MLSNRQDEHFHVPQAQKYCAFDFHSWDPKLTTPPGLYAYSLLWTFGRCDVSDLRFIGLTILAALFVVCFSVRVSLYSGKAQAGERDTIRRGSGNAAHAAFNICLFPPLFFFSGLYYTDVLSTLVVILAYYVFLRRGPNSSSILSGVATFFLGIVGLFMRQTNIFWVGIFLAALEWVRTCKEISASKEANKLNDRPGSWLEKTILPYTSGQLHDPALGQAGPFGELRPNVSARRTNGPRFLLVSRQYRRLSRQPSTSPDLSPMAIHCSPPLIWRFRGLERWRRVRYICNPISSLIIQ